MLNSAEINGETGATGHTSLIVFHGIGKPRHLATLSKFIEKYCKATEGDEFKPMGSIKTSELKIEESEDGSTRYIIQLEIRQQNEQKKTVRSYEGYWGDDRARHISFAMFLAMILKINVNAFKIRFSYWSQFPSYRLRSLYAAPEKQLTSLQREALESLYRDFARRTSTSQHWRGGFSLFIEMLKRPEVTKRHGDLVGAAKTWRKKENKRTCDIFQYGLLTLFIFIFLLIVPSDLAIKSLTNDKPIVARQAFLTLVTFILAFGCLGWFFWRSFKTRLSDIYYWTTTDERSSAYIVRERRLALAEALIWEVITNVKCNDCVIVGHSLGSAIAVEALSRVATRAEALDLSPDIRKQRLYQIKKIKAVFLLGSPIDTLFSSFQDDLGDSPIYTSFREKIRPSLNNIIFSGYNNSGGAQIVNFWSRFDPISSEIFSLRTPFLSAQNTVINCESIPEGIPRFGRSHSGYYGDEGVMRPIHEAITQGQVNVSHLDQSVPYNLKSKTMVVSSLGCLASFGVVFHGAAHPNAISLIVGFIVFLAFASLYLSSYAKAVKTGKRKHRNSLRASVSQPKLSPLPRTSHTVK